MDEMSIKLNKIAQEVIPVSEGVTWFTALSTESQRAVLQKLQGHILQAHPTDDHLQTAINESGLKRTTTPIVLLERPNLGVSLSKIVNLPRYEMVPAFRLLILLFSLADKQRRVDSCGDNCSHWWHHLDDHH